MIRCDNYNLHSPLISTKRQSVGQSRRSQIQVQPQVQDPTKWADGDWIKSDRMILGGNIDNIASVSGRLKRGQPDFALMDCNRCDGIGWDPD